MRKTGLCLNLSLLMLSILVQIIRNYMYLPSTFFAGSLTATALVPQLSPPLRALSLSSSHLCALGAGMNAAYPWEEEASPERLQVADHLTLPRSAVSISDPDQTRSHLMILIYIATCFLRDHIVLPRDNNMISRAGSEAQ